MESQDGLDEEELGPEINPVRCIRTFFVSVVVLGSAPFCGSTALGPPLRVIRCAPPSLPFGRSIVTFAGRGITSRGGSAPSFSIAVSFVVTTGFFSSAGATGCCITDFVGADFGGTFLVGAAEGALTALGALVDLLVAGTGKALPKAPAGLGSPDFATDMGGCGGEDITVTIRVLFPITTVEEISASAVTLALDAVLMRAL